MSALAQYRQDQSDRYQNKMSQDKSDKTNSQRQAIEYLNSMLKNGSQENLAGGKKAQLLGIDKRNGSNQREPSTLQRKLTAEETLVKPLHIDETKLDANT